MINLTPHIDQETYQPLFFRLAKPEDEQALTQLMADDQISEIVDALPEALVDLFRIDFPFAAQGSPEFKKSLARYTERYLNGQPMEKVGVWVYFPWKRSLVHLPEAEDYYKLRTARNKFLITAEEQDLFYNAHIGIAGLSVGSSVLNAVVLSGGGGNIRIADIDILSITNLNRLMASVCDLDRSKAIAAARRTYEINPYQNLTLFTDGLTQDNMEEFFTKDGKKLDLFVEEMDNIKLKIESRFKARELQIPVVMATDNGDNTILDVERFDLEPDRPLFHGSVSEDRLKNLPDNPPIGEKVKLANRIVGPDVVPRMQLSLTQVGSKLPTWPQLGNAAILSGAATSYVARRILAGEDMPSGRYEVHFDELIDPHYKTEAAQADRAQKKAEFIKSSELLFGKD